MKALICLGLFFLLSNQNSADPADISLDWKPVSPSYLWNKIAFKEEYGKVSLFDSVVYSPGKLFYQAQNENNENQIIRIDLISGEKKIFPFPEGKIIGWSFHDGGLLILTKKKLSFYDLESMVKKREVTSSIQSNNFRDILVLSDVLHSFQNKKVFTYDLQSGNKLEEKDFPHDAVQRVVRIDENTLALYSSYWGNKLKLINSKTYAFIKEIIIPTNHRSLFKLVYTEKERFLVLDPLTQNFSEWMEFGGVIVGVSDGLEIVTSPAAARFSPIENFIEYKLEITAKEDIPETVIHFLLPRENTYSQEVSEERYSKASEVSRDAFGNRILALSVPALKKGQVFSHSPYEAKLKRFKISFALDNLELEVKDLEVPDSLLQYTRDYSLLKFTDEIVIGKRNQILGDSTKLKDVLKNTIVYVSSIPYKAGAFSSAPIVIEKNNGGCTEHSYVTMAFLRSIGIPSRLVWNYLPTESSDRIFLNHKFVEAWLPKYGWIPLEPLAPPFQKPGSTSARHVIFAGLEKVSLKEIAGGDRLFNLSPADLPQAKKMLLLFDIIKSGVGEMLEKDMLKIKSVPKINGNETVIP